ncbi:MAG: hypothetical protein ABIS59_04240 [Candidatus Saccharibacteria bacterium]
MAKKKTHKKQSFKYAQPTAHADAMTVSPVTMSASTPTRTSNAVVLTTLNDNPYLGQDLTKLGIIAVSLIVLEFVLSALFSHTSLGSTVYNLYKIAS